jgi:predicted Fe-Mo cluster-binding NifX family protein
MKIAIPVDEQSIKSSVSQSFGRTGYFFVYDTESKASIFLSNAAASSQGGAGIKAAQAVVDSRIDVLLTPRCGENAAEVIKSANIKIYKTMEGSAMENIDAMIEGKLSLLQDIHPGYHGHGGS